MKLYGETEYGAAELEIERKPMPEKHFKALCRIVYAAIYAVAQVAALWLVGKIALVALLPASFVALIAVLMDEDPP